jgi:hypothetical protein
MSSSAEMCEEEEEEPYLYILHDSLVHVDLYRGPTAHVSRSFGLRSSYEIDILDTDQRPRNKSSAAEPI